MGTHFYGERASGHRALRRGRVSIPGQTYLVTFTTHQRACLFRDLEHAGCVARSLHGLAIWKETKLLAWVLMPDHLHLLITLSEKENLQSVVQKLKSNTARELKTFDLSLGQVWATAFHDRALRNDEDVRDVARYLVLNPVRAGLVSRVGDYPFWNAAWFLISVATYVAPTSNILRQPSRPSFSSVSTLRSTMASASGNASTARLTLSSRSRCRVG